MGEERLEREIRNGFDEALTETVESVETKAPELAEQACPGYAIVRATTDAPEAIVTELEWYLDSLNASVNYDEA